MILSTVTHKSSHILKAGLSVLVAIALLISAAPVSHIKTAKAADGYLGTCHELHEALTAVDGLTKHYALSSDLDCTNAGLLAENAATALRENDFLFGEFTGTLNGQGNQLKLSFGSDNTEAINGMGLFSELDGATVTGLNLDVELAVDLTDDSQVFNVGSLAGSVTNSTVFDITAQVDIELGNELNVDAQAVDINSVGGLVGRCVTSCSFQNITMTSSVAYNADFTPNSVSYVGGLVGSIDDGLAGADSIKNVTVETQLCLEKSTYVGGLAGRLMTAITPTTVDSVAVLSAGGGCGVTGGDYLGGLTGYVSAASVVRNSYARLDVTRTYILVQAYGGFVGKNDGSIYTSYSTGNVDAVTGADAGGFVGSNHDTIESSFSAATSVATTGTKGGFVGWNNNDGDEIEGVVLNSAWVVIDGLNAIGSDQAAGTPLALLTDFDASNFDLPTLGGAAPLKENPTHDLYAGGDPVAHAVWDFDDVWTFTEGVNDDFPVLQMQGTPVVGTGEVESLAKTSAFVWGEILSVGGAPIQADGFYYGTTEVVPTTVADLAGYDQDIFVDNTLNAGEWKVAPALFEAQLTNLNCGTTYYYIYVAAQNVADEDTYDIGAERSLTTLACGGGGSGGRSLVSAPDKQAKPNGTLILDNGTVYLLANQQRIPFRDPVEYATHGYNFSQVVTASAADMELPEGPIRKAMEGSLVLDSSDGVTVYMIGLNETKRGFTSLQVFTELGYDFNGIPAIDLTDYPVGDVINDSSLAHPEGALVIDQGTIWWILNGLRRGFESEAVFETYGFSYARAVPANSADMSLLEGSLVKFRDGTLVLDDGRYYIISDGQKRQFTSEETLQNWGYNLNNVISGSLQNYEAGSKL